MRKNTAGQVVMAQMVSATDGSAFTGSVAVSVTGDGGTQATGSVGSGACTHEGNGLHSYAPAQAETNYDHVAFTFTGTGAVPATVQVYTRYDANLTHSLGVAVTNADGTAQAGTSTTITLAAGSSATDDFYVDNVIRIVAGTGAGQSRVVTGYVGATKVATVGEAWAVSPSSDSQYVFEGNADVGTGTGLAAADIRAAVGLASANLDAQLSAIDDAVDAEVAAVLAAVDTEVAAIKAKTDNLPASPAAVGSAMTLTGTQTFNMTGNVTGNLSGSVGSVTGAVGSVTGNVGGNVVGSVGSVTGSVGSVTGNVGGNVVGSVGSVTGNVGGNVSGSVGSVSGVTFPANFGSLVISAGGSANADVKALAGTTLGGAGTEGDPWGPA